MPTIGWTSHTTFNSVLSRSMRGLFELSPLVYVNAGRENARFRNFSHPGQNVLTSCNRQKIYCVKYRCFKTVQYELDRPRSGFKLLTQYLNTNELGRDPHTVLIVYI